MKKKFLILFILSIGFTPMFAFDFVVDRIAYQIILGRNNEVRIPTYGGYFANEWVVIPDSIFRNGRYLRVTQIANRAFMGSRIRDIIIPNGIVSIGDEAFKNSNLQSINIPLGLRNIGNEAFAGSSLRKINIGNGRANDFGLRMFVFESEQISNNTKRYVSQAPKPSEASATPTFFPSLSSLVRVNQNFPRDLSFMKPQIEEILKSIFYRNMQFVGGRGSASYLLDLIIPRELSIDIFDTGISLIVFPNNENNGSSPTSFDYQLPIEQVMPNFNREEFNWTAKEILDILHFAVFIPNQINLETSIRLFEGGETIEAFSQAMRRNQPFEDGKAFEAVSAFINRVNAHYNLRRRNAIPLPEKTDFSSMVTTTLQSIESNATLRANNIGVRDILFDLYLNTSLSDDCHYLSSHRGSNLNRYVFTITGSSVLGYIRDLIYPRIHASVDNIALGLAFPPSLLSPADSTGRSVPEPSHSVLRFSEKKIELSPWGGGVHFFGSNRVADVRLNHLSKIANTGILIHLDNSKGFLDLSQTITQNWWFEDDIPMLLYPDDVIGAYIVNATALLPKRWFYQSDGCDFFDTIEWSGSFFIGTYGLRGIIRLQNF